MGLASTTADSIFVEHEDVEREIRRLRRLGIETQIGSLDNMSGPGDDGWRRVAFFWPVVDGGGWTIRLSPSATEEEQLDALNRAFECISNPETHPWWQEYPEILQGMKDGWFMVLHAPRHPSRDQFATSLAKEIEEFVRMKIRQASPSMLGACGYYEGGMRPHAERFDDYGSRIRTTRHSLNDRPALVAGEIRAEMARQFKTNAQLSELLNVSVASARRALKGDRAFREREVIAIADWLELDIDDLLTNRYGEVAP